MWMIENLKDLQSTDLAVGDLVRFMCNLCRIETIQKLETIHSVLRFEGYYNTNDIWDGGEFPKELEVQYQFYVCQGCGAACLHEATRVLIESEFMFSSFSPTRLPPDNVTGYWDNSPPPEKLSPKSYNGLPKKLEIVYREAIQAYNADMLLSCAIIMRALIEGVCVEKEITDTDAYGLQKKLNLLKDRKILPENVVEGLSVFKFMGDNAAHHLEISDKQTIKLALEVIEDVLNGLFEVNYRLTLNARMLKDRGKLHKNPESE
jgi:hypothetical protein